jgi:hypothetical protein
LGTKKPLVGLQYEGFVNVLFQEIKRNKPIIKWIASRLMAQMYFIYLEKKNFFCFYRLEINII